MLVLNSDDLGLDGCSCVRYWWRVGLVVKVWLFRCGEALPWVKRRILLSLSVGGVVFVRLGVLLRFSVAGVMRGRLVVLPLFSIAGVMRGRLVVLPLFSIARVMRCCLRMLLRLTRVLLLVVW